MAAGAVGTARAAAWQRVPAGDDAVAVAERAALGTSARVVVWPPGNLDPACAAVNDVLAALDLQASRFRPDSELSWLNAARVGCSCSATVWPRRSAWRWPRPGGPAG